MNAGMHRTAGLALLLALAVIVHTVEALTPFTAAWFRFGFANIITVATLYLYGFKDAFFVTIGRILLGALALGALGSPGFVLSLSGGILSVLVMRVAMAPGPRVFSEIGVSIAGAAAHNMGQLMAAYFVLIKSDAVFLLVPWMLLGAVVTGMLNGVAAQALIARFGAHEATVIE